MACHLSSVVFERVLLVDSENGLGETGALVLRVEDHVAYFSFCDDFGPMNLGNIFQFCNLVDEYLQQKEENLLAVIPSEGAQSLTNAVFLLGTYMIMRLDLDFVIVRERLEPQC